MSDVKGDGISQEDLLQHAVKIVTSYNSRNTISHADLPSFIRATYSNLAGLVSAGEPAEELVPAVSVRRSIQHDKIVCLECGRGMKMIRRHLMAEHDMTPDEYRERWGLSRDYPMVAPGYSQTRSELAHRIGLGRTTREEVEEVEEEVEEKSVPKKRSRKAGASAKSASTTKSGSARKAASSSSKSAAVKQSAPKKRGRTPAEDFEEDLPLEELEQPEVEEVAAQHEPEDVEEIEAAAEDEEVFETVDDYEVVDEENERVPDDHYAE